MAQMLIRGWSIRDAEQHLIRSCPVMAALITKYGPCSLADREFRPFQTLVRAIISQQLSAKAADTIEDRIRALVPNFDPAEFLRAQPMELRAAGLSSAKARYIIELAQRVECGLLNLNAMQEVPDAEVIATLVDLPGIGRWTAEMFLIFGLGRPDVLSLDDAGLRRAVRLLFGKDAELEELGYSWQPFRSVASWYLWRHLDD
jgi:3-methyladenine DNA glycosylase/8-oxoguanine DNA glycosylase